MKSCHAKDVLAKTILKQYIFTLTVLVLSYIQLGPIT